MDRASSTDPPRAIPTDPPDAALRRYAEAIDRYLAAPRRAETCSVSGTGAVAELEARACVDHDVRHAIAVSSGTAALLGGLLALGIEPASHVVTLSSDWPAGAAAARAIGCHVTTVGSWDQLPIEMLESHIGRRCTAIVVASPGRQTEHLDICERLAGRGVAVVEDLANVWGQRPLAGIAATSLGPGKTIDAGEGGLILTNDDDLAAVVERHTQHPNRQRLRGIAPSTYAPLCMRMHPVAAVVALYEIGRRALTHPGR